MKKILVIGNSARLDCILDALYNSKSDKEIFTITPNNNNAISSKSNDVKILKDLLDFDSILEYSKKVKPDYVIIGPELPLVNGIVDLLEENGFPCVGPTKKCAKLEGSKSYCRFISDNATKFNINPKYKEYVAEKLLHEIDEIRRIHERQLAITFKDFGDYVLKPDGLTGGKGVLVKGEHFETDIEAYELAIQITKDHGVVVIEEKLIGEEFSFISFTDGYTLRHSFPVQDNKRAYDGDTGPNTGGMGSYSLENNSLPFLSYGDIALVKDINMRMLRTLKEHTGERFKGFIYGGFMKTVGGIKLIEYNVRLGDPEVMNILPLLETDFVELTYAMAAEGLKDVNIKFKNSATVCKYVVPEQYPNNSVDAIISNIPKSSKNIKVYYGNVSNTSSGLKTLGSRAIAIVGIGKNIKKAEKRSSDACKEIKGPIRYRNDIGIISKKDK